MAVVSTVQISEHGRNINGHWSQDVELRPAPLLFSLRPWWRVVLTTVTHLHQPPLHQPPAIASDSDRNTSRTMSSQQTAELPPRPRGGHDINLTERGGSKSPHWFRGTSPSSRQSDRPRNCRAQEVLDARTHGEARSKQYHHHGPDSSLDCTHQHCRIGSAGHYDRRPPCQTGSSIGSPPQFQEHVEAENSKSA